MNAQGAAGTYSLVLGPQVLAALDNAAMDQDADGIAAEATDTYAANLTLDRFPGPEGFGYESNAYPFENINLVIGQPGVVTLVSTADDTAGQINLGTNTFNYYGTTYTGAASTVWANPNGLMSFGSSTTAFTNGDLTTAPTQRALAILWDDWRTDQNTAGATDSAVLYKLEDTNGDATPDRLIVEWSDVPNRTAADGTVTFQAILQLNTGATPGRIIYNYVDTVTSNATFSNGASSSVGIKDTGTQGARRLLLMQNQNNHPWVGSGKAILVALDVVPPAVTASSFGYLTANQVKFTFSEDVSASLSAADLVLHNVTTNTDVPTAAIAMSYDAGTNTATFTVPGLPGARLANGDYTATLVAAGITDAAGNALDGNADFVAGGDFSQSFFFLNGDANRDRAVNLLDFNILSTNFGQSPRDFSQGDLNYDGQVNLIDFNILSGNFGQSLGPEAGSAVQLGDGLVTGTTPLFNAKLANALFGPAADKSLFGDRIIALLTGQDEVVTTVG
jgi:hypothetical protein